MQRFAHGDADPEDDGGSRERQHHPGGAGAPQPAAKPATLTADAHLA